MERFRVASGRPFRLASVDPEHTFGTDERRANQILDERRERIADIQNRLYAESDRALLIILQSMDTGGKDPIIRDVLNRANSQACRVTAFKKPNAAEKSHHRLWRFNHGLPSMGEIAVFNRAYYDDVIASDAHEERSHPQLDRYYRQINDFELMLTEEKVTVIKLFLHISKDEQRRRLQERMENPDRQWELSESDFEERQYWDGYMRAYEHAINQTHTDHAPWFVIPSDRSWFRDAAAAEIICDVLERMNPQFPPPSIDLSKVSLD